MGDGSAQACASIVPLIAGLSEPPLAARAVAPGPARRLCLGPRAAARRAAAVGLNPLAGASGRGPECPRGARRRSRRCGRAARAPARRRRARGRGAHARSAAQAHLHERRVADGPPDPAHETALGLADLRELLDERGRDEPGCQIVELAHVGDGFFPATDSRVMGRPGVMSPFTRLPRPASPSSPASADVPVTVRYTAPRSGRSPAFTRTATGRAVSSRALRAAISATFARCARYCPRSPQCRPTIAHATVSSMRPAAAQAHHLHVLADLGMLPLRLRRVQVALHPLHYALEIGERRVAHAAGGVAREGLLVDPDELARAGVDETVERTCRSGSRAWKQRRR